MMGFCNNCGAPVPATAHFCTACGRAIPQASIAPAVRVEDNWIYVVWFLFYFLLVAFFTGGLAIPLYIITTILAFSKVAEKLWRRVSGVRPLRLKSEKERLLPLFREVYMGAVRVNPNLSRGIKLYIKEDMTINAFAFGKSTLVLTRGSLELLNDSCLKGLMAHELGHFSYRHTEAFLLSTVSNFHISFMMNKLTDLKNRLDNSKNRGGFMNMIFKTIIDLIYYSFRSTDFIGELILMHTSRKNEYLADGFANQSGFGANLTEVLIELYRASVSKPQSVKEQLKSTHPDITLRIERLERGLY